MEPTVSGDVTTNSSNGTESSHFNELYMLSTILAFLAVIGAAGNAIVICVFNRKGDNSVSTFFILILAIVDILACLFNIPFVIVTENVAHELRYDFICKIGIFLDIANILFSAFVMVAIAIDRYFAICHPFKRVMTVSRAKFLVVCMAVIASSIGVCVSLMYGVYDYEAEDWSSLEDGETFGSTEGRKGSTPGIYQSEIDNNFSGVEVFLKQSTAGFNPMSDPTETSHAERQYATIYDGYCAMNEIIFSMEVHTALHHLHSALYLFCFVVVLVLYILIYRSVLLQRKIRRHLQNKTHQSITLTTQTSITANRRSNRTSFEELPLATSTTHSPPADNDNLDLPSLNNSPLQIGERSSPHSAESAATRAANLKTAAMLFVVTIVFSVSHLPSILMEHDLIPINLTVFYMYFVNSVANPIIYSFMNRNFRQKVKNLLSRR